MALRRQKKMKASNSLDRIHGREGLSAGRLPGNGGSGPQHRRLVLRFLQEEVVERHHHPAIIAPSASAHPHKGWALDM